MGNIYIVGEYIINIIDTEYGFILRIWKGTDLWKLNNAYINLCADSDIIADLCFFLNIYTIVTIVIFWSLVTENGISIGPNERTELGFFNKSGNVPL